jgi:hypothetical protein
MENRGIWVLVILLFLYLFVPQDLLIRANVRIGYYGTRYYETEILFKDITEYYTFNLKDCKIYFWDIQE